MTTIRGKSALVVGGSSGVGRSTVIALLAQGAHVTAVARDAERLRALEIEVGRTVEGSLTTVAGDATSEAFVVRLLQDTAPELIVLAGGVIVSSALFTEMSWETFSEAWNGDLQWTFHFLKHAHTLPLAAGTTIVVVSSGAAVNGSPISGGYAGAKRMQWLLASYAQKFSDSKALGIRTMVVVPTQLIEGTAIAARAASVYGAMEGLSAQEFMSRFAVPLTTDIVADAIIGALRGDFAKEVGAVRVSGTVVEAIP